MLKIKRYSSLFDKKMDLKDALKLVLQLTF